MLNFNTIDNPNAFPHSIPLHGGNFNGSSTTMITSSPTNHSAQSQAQQINLNYLNSNTSGDQTTWAHTESVNNSLNSTIDENCNRNNNTLTDPGEVRGQHQKDYSQTVISGGDTHDRSKLTMGNYVEGSENVKRFSVNNLLQLANNCRALVNEHQLSSGKKYFSNHKLIERHIIPKLI